MNYFLITFAQVSILAVEIGLGYFFTKKEKIPPSALPVLTFLCANIALPCSIFLAVAALDPTSGIWGSLATELLVIIPCAIIQIGVSFRLFGREDIRRRSVYQIATIYSNSAFMGIPIVMALIGAEAIVYVTLLVAFDTIFLFAHASLALGNEKINCLDLLKKVCTPMTAALFLGVAVSVCQIRLPSLLLTCLTDFRGLLTPLAMVIIGMQLARQNLSAIFRRRDYYAVAAIKLLFWPTLIMICLLPLRAQLPAALSMTVVICKATPQPAVLGAVAAANDLDGEAAAGIVGLCTILCAFTLPVIAAVCKMLF